MPAQIAPTTVLLATRKSVTEIFASIPRPLEAAIFPGLMMRFPSTRTRVEELSTMIPFSTVSWMKTLRMMPSVTSSNSIPH